MKKNGNKILVFACHPDDAEIGMGGTISRFSRSCNKVKVVDLTDGEPTPCGSRQLRKKESFKAAEILGFERENMGWENRNLTFDRDKRDMLARIIRAERPAAVFIPCPDDPHPDHRQGAKISSDAVFAARLSRYPVEGKTFRVKKVYCYLSIHGKKPSVPDIYVPLTPREHEIKMQAVMSYDSQFKKNKANREIPDFIRARDRYFGYMCSAPYGEGFMSMQGVEADFLENV